MLLQHAQVGPARPLLAAVLSWSSFATAQTSQPLTEQGPKVEVAQCKSLDPSEVTSFIALELEAYSELRDIAEYFHLRLECDGEEIRMRVLDGSGATKLKRTIPAPQDDNEEPERVVALAASELFLTLRWISEDELRASVDAAKKPPADKKSEPKTESTPPAESPSAQLAASPAEKARLKVRGGALVGVRSFSSEPIIQPGAVLDLGLQVPSPLEVGIGFSGQWGSTTRRSGKINTLTLATGLSAGSHLNLSDDWRLRGALALRALYVQATGVPGAVDVAGARLSGWNPDVMVSVGPEWWASSWGLGLYALGGLTPGSLEAQVDNEEPLELGGPWAGISFQLLHE